MIAHILLVDDEPHVVRFMSNLINAQGDIMAEVFEAKSAREALFWLEHSRIDLMITDIEMPEMGGVELIQVVRERWQDCRTIVLTAHAQFDYAYQTIHLGIVDYILKTESDIVIMEHVRAAINSLECERSRDSGQVLQGRLDAPKPTADLTDLLRGKSDDPARFGFDTGAPLVLVCCKPNDVDDRSAQLLIRHYIEPGMVNTVYSGMDGLSLWLFEPKPSIGKTGETILSWFEGTLESIQDTLTNAHNTDFSMVLCRPVHTAAQLRSQFDQARVVLNSLGLEKTGMLYTLPVDSEAREPISENESIQMIYEYINSHISEDISLLKLAELTNFNASYLSRFFHRKTGQTLKQCIAQTKMRRIRTLMMDENNSLSDIMEMTGFESRSYFNRFINHMAGTSPQKLRASILHKE